MPSSSNKRRRISNEDGPSASTRQAPQTPPPKPTTALPNYMTPTKASLAKSYPHLIPKSPARTNPQIPSPKKRPQFFATRQVRNSPLKERSFLEIASEGDDDAAVADANGDESGLQTVDSRMKKQKETHLETEEEIERQRAILMCRVRLLRAECESLEQQIEQVVESKESADDIERTIQQDMDTTMYIIISYVLN
jgi:hypothetical protein